MEDDDFQSRLADWSTRNVGNEPEEQDEEERAPVVQDEPQAEQAQAPFSEDQLSGFMERNSPSRIGMYLGNAVHSFNSTMGDIAATLNAGIGTMVRERDGVNKLGIVMRGGQNVLDANAEFARKARVGEELLARDNGEIKDISDETKKYLSDQVRLRRQNIPSRSENPDYLPPGAMAITEQTVADEARKTAQSKEWQQTREDSLKYLQNRARENGFAFNPKSQRSDAWESEFMEQMRLSDMARNAEQRKPLNELPDRDVVLRSPEQIWNQRASDRVHEAEAAYNAHSAASQASRTFFNDAISNNLVDINAQNEYLHNLGFKYGGEKGGGFWGRTGETLERMLVDVTDQTGNITLMLAAQGAVGLAAKASAAAQGATAVAGGAVAEAATSLGMADVAMAATRTAAVNTAKSVGLQAMGRALQAGFIASEFQGAMDEARDLGIPDAEAARHAMEYGVVAGILENAGQIINVAGLNGKTVSKFGRAVFGNKAFSPEALATLAGTMKQAGVKIGARIIDQVADATGEGLEEITQTTAQGMAMAAVIDEYCDRHNLNKAEFLAAHDGAPYKIGKDGTVRYDIGKAVEEIRESGLAGAGSAFGTALLGMGGGVAKRAFRGRTAAVAGVSAVTGLDATRIEAVYGDNACEVVAHALAGVRNDEDVAKRREILANEVSDEDFGEDALRLFDYCIDNAKVTETAAMSGLSSKFQVPASMNEGWEESDGGALWSYSNDGITIVQDVVNNEITVLNEETGQTVKADSPNAALAAANRYSIENQARQAVLANRVEYFGNMMQRLAPEDFKRTSVYMTTREALEKEPDIRNSLIADIGEDVVAAAREIGGDEAVNALLESKFEGGTLNDGRIVFAADKMSGPWKMMQLINHETTHSGILSANSWDKKKSADFIRNMNVAKPQGFDAEAERGFRGLTESQRNSFAWQFWMRADRIKRNLGYEEGSPKLMEETIAYFFQDRANRPSMWSRMKHALFQTLRDNAGRNIALQESDIEVMVDAWRHDPSKLTKNDRAAPEAPAAKGETTPTPEPTPAPKAEATPKVEPTPAAAPKTETPTPAPETATPETAPAAKTETPVETAAAKPSNDEKAPEVKQPKAEETPAAKTETTPAPETAPKAENAASAEESAKTPAEWLAEKGITIRKGTYDAVTKKLAESKDNDTVSGVLERRILPENAPALSRQTRKALVSKLNKMGFRVNEKSTDTTLLRNLLEKYTDETGRAAPASASTTTPAAATPAESKTQTKARGPSAYITPTEKSRTIPISKLRTLKDEPQKSIDNAWGFMEKAARGEADKRKPIHVVDNGDGTFTVIDGNATTWAMARHGETEIIAEVVGKDRGTRIANSHYEIQEEGVKDADGNKIALRAGGFDGMDVKSEAAREKAYADAEENLPALEELTRKAAAKVGGEVMLHPENKAGADTDEREVGKRVKKRSRVEDKKADYKGDYSGVVDLIGTTITLTPDKDMSDAVKAIRKNLPEGASVARVKFLSNPDKGGYWDVKVSVRFANGGIGEIIVADAYLTLAKFKRGGHELYDYQRALEDAKETDDEAADLYFALKQIELAIYSHNTPQAEAWRAGWDSAKATASSSLTRFLESHGRDFISSIDMGALKDLLSGTHLHQPASLDSYATPAFSFIQNDISSSSSNDNNIIAESGEKGKKEAGQAAPTKASNSFSVITPDGEMTVEGNWEAVPADKIVTSFDPRYKQFERHMQNRITTGKTNEQKVEKYANNPLYRMAGNSEISDTGAAFGVWHDGLCYIVAGNHHTRGIQLSFERGKGTQFEADARADMERRGVKVPDGNFIPIRIIDGMTREQLVEFADKSNQRATQEHRDGEKAVKDVPIIKKHISKLHGDADLTAKENVDFIEELLNTFNDTSLRDSDLTPNDKAYRRVRLALVAAMLSATDEDAATTLTQIFAEKAESLGLQNIIDGVTRAAAPVLSATDAAKGTNLDFGRHLAEALRVIVDFKQNGGKSMKAFLAQEGFDFGDKQALSGEAKALAQAIAENANAPQRISALLSDVATRVEKAVGEKEQAGLFVAEEAPNLEKIVNASIEAMSGKASAAEVDALRSRAPALFDALWKDTDGTSEALSEVERQMNHVRDSKDKSSAIRPFKGEARKQAMKYWGAEHPAGKSKLAPGPVTVKPEAPAKSETAKPAETPAASEAPAQAPAPQTSTKAKKPAAKPRATKATTTEEAAPAPVSQTPATPQAPTAQQGGTTIAGVELSADDIKAFSDLGSGIMASFSRGDVDADTVSKGNQFVGLAVQRGVKDFRTFATLAKRFVYGKADDERRAGVQNFLAARWSQYLMDNPDSGIEEMLPSKMRTVFDEIDNEQTAPAPAPTQENTQNQEQKNEAPSTNETREEASENPVKEPEANPVERTETQREPPKPVKRETSPRAPAKAKHTVVGKPLLPIIAAAPTSRGARLAANIEAIRIAKELDTTGRTATEAEREKLAKFTGWGGLGSVFNYYDERSQLEQVLEPNEMEAAKLSANSAYFTPTNITSALWDIARALGFNGGTMLEGSAGVGNIISAIPQDLRANTDVRAVEIDPISALILRGLHPQIAVDVNGFQDVNIPAGSVNLAITNVPFVTGLRVYDKSNKDLSDRFKDLHDFCIAKNIRALAEGGIGIFITTSNTLDKSDALRRWITDQGNADVIGAFRMPNDTFGGTAVTSDIIVVRKRVGGEKSAAAIDVSTAPVERSVEYDGKTVAMYLNKYFHDHPEMMGGEMAFNFEKGETYRATSYGLFPTAGIDAKARLADFVKSMEGKRSEMRRPEKSDAPREQHTFKLEDETIHEGELHVAKNGEVCIARGGESVPLDMKSMKNKVAGANGKGKYTRAAVVKDYGDVKTSLHALLDAQKDTAKTDADIESLIKKFNGAYDWFVRKYGPLNMNNRISWLDRDIYWPELCALETITQDANPSNKGYVATIFNAKDGIYTHFGKSDVFTKRVISVEKAQKPANVTDAILLDYRNTAKVSAENVARMLGISTEDATAQMLESGLAFIDPATSALTIRHDYLSGNVREKLAIAQAQNENGKYDANIKALNEVMPPTIPAHLIGYTLGSTWLPTRVYTRFFEDRFDAKISLQNIGGRWVIGLPGYAYGKNFSSGVLSSLTGKRISGAEIAAAAMKGQSTIPVTQIEKIGESQTRTIHDRAAESTISAKIDEIRDDFKSFVQKMARDDEAFAAEVEGIYNERFNNLAKRVIDDRFLPDHFEGANPDVKLYPHQKRAVILGTTQPVMLAHEVGSGKTYTLITTAMEMRRLGTARKPMIVVQNATIGQFVASAKKLYPAARILAPSKSDTGEAGRKEFFAKAKFNDWDMVIVPQSMFGMIPDSEESQMQYIAETLEEKRQVLEAISKEDDKESKRATAQIEKEIGELVGKFRAAQEKSKGKAAKKAKDQALADEKVKERAKRLLDRKVDEVETFQDMDIDALLIDEAHNYKKLGFSTALSGRNSRVKGIDTTASKKAVSTYMKIRSILASQNGRNVVMATGTPISNTAAEIWTFMRYLMPIDARRSYGLEYFDDFVHNFGDISQLLEFNTSGQFKENTRFAGYFNTPELVRLWQTVSDTVLAKDTVVSKALPDVDGGTAQDVFLPQTPTLAGTMKSIREWLKMYEKMSGKEKKENSHIPLVAFGRAKAAAIDVRLLDPTEKDEPGSKTNMAVGLIVEDLKSTTDHNGTVAVFCDRNKHQTDGKVDFNLFDDMKQKLISRGIPTEQIAIIEPGMTDSRKVEIFDKIKAGEIRVVFGSTETLGTGVNIQDRLHMAIHMDAPPRPMDYTQRNGRILRQGNKWKIWGQPIRIVRFGVEDCLDVSAYQRLKTKSEFINSVMNLSAKDQFDALESRSIEDSEEEGVFDNPVATLSGSQYALLKNKAERDLRKLRAKQESYEADQIYLKRELEYIPGRIKFNEDSIAEKRAELQKLRDAGFTEEGARAVEFNGKKFAVDDKDGIGKQLSEDFNKQLVAARKEAQGVTFGASYHKVLNLPVKVDGVEFTIRAIVKAEKMFSDKGLPFMRSTTEIGWVCPALDKKTFVETGGQWATSAFDGIVEYTKGAGLRSDVERTEGTIRLLRAQEESARARYGIPFAEEEALKEAEARVKDYEQKMKEELAAKEAKYADVKAAQGMSLDAAAQEEADNSDMAQGAAFSRGDEDMDAEGYFGNERYDGFRVNMQDVVTAADADNAPLRPEAAREFADTGVRFSIREEDPPKNTGIGYKVFFLKDGKLYPPMVANPGGADTPIGVWLNADEGVRAEKSKNGRDKVKAGGKGTQGGGGTLAWRPGWHLGTIPYALQFNRGEKVDNPLGIMNQKGEVIKVGRFFPANFVWAEVEYAADVDYQEEAMSYGMTPNGKFQHSLAGLPRLPKDGFYQYRTNANPATDPWIITGAMRVRRVLSDDEVDALVREAGREPQEREARFTADDAKSVNSHLTLPGGKVIDAADAWQYRDGADKLHATRWSKFLGRAVTQELDGVLDRLMSGEEVPESEIEATPEWSEAKARAAIDESGLQKKYGANVKATADIDTEERKALRHEIIEAALAPVVQHQVEIGSTGLKFTMNEALEPKKGKPAPMPYTVAQDHVAIVVTGLPSAGKSSVFVNAVSTFYKARVCDSDAVKAALPEFDNGYGGNAVHNESSNINEEILDRATRRGDNVVYPILGFKAESLRNKILKELRARGYNVHILCNDLPPAKATARLIMRFLEKGRYLPLFCIYKAAGKTQPAYQEVKNEYDSYALYSNDVSFGERPRRIESSRGGILEAVPAFQGSVGEPTVLRPAVGSQGIIRDGTGEVGNGTVLQMAGEPSATSGLDDGAAFSRGDESRFEVTPEEAAAIRALDIHGGKNYLVGASQLARFYSQHEYSPERLTKENVWEESFGIDAPALVSEIVKKPRVLTPYEHAAMVRHLASYEARLDALTQKQNELEKTPGTPTETLATLDNEIAVLGGAIKTIYAAFDYAGTKAGQALAFRNLIQNAEMTAGWMIRRMKTQMENFHVDAMPTGFMDELERFAREYKQVKQDLETAQGELVRKDAEAEQMNEILRNLRNRPKKDPGTRLAEIMSQTQDLVDAQGELSDYQIEKLVKKVAAEYVALDSSYRDVDTLLGEVRKYLDIAGIELDDAQVREYFAGRANIYDRNEARKLANRLQKQVAKAVALEEALQNGDIREMRRVCRRLGLAIHDGQAIIDAQNAAILAMLDDEIAELEAELGEKPKPTMFSIDENPKAPRPAGRKSAAADVADNGKARLERLRALRAEIASADADDTRTARIREYARSRLAREQARLQNVLGKTHEDAGTVPPASTPELEDAERELRNAEREEREARRRGEQNVANQEQKRIQRLREKVAALEKQVLDAQEGFFMNDMPKMKKRRAMSDEETALVQRVAELRHAYRTLLDAQFPGEQSAEERAIRARQRAIQRSIDHLQNKMEGSEQAQNQPKKDYSNDPRLDDLKKQLREKKKEYLDWEAAQNWKAMSTGGKALKTVADLFDLTKSLVASGDLSAIWTQCGWMMLGNPRLNVRAVRDGFRSLFSGKQSEDIMNKLARDYDLARFVEDGLEIHAVGTAAESEMFARNSNPLLNKLIPPDNKLRKLGGMWLEASARGFDTPINIIRTTTYAAALNACQKNGKMLGQEERQTLAQLINYATGTGDMKFFKQGVFKRLLWAPSRISGQIQTIQNMVNLGLSSMSDKFATQKFKNFDLDVRRNMFWQVYGKSLTNYMALTAVLYALSRLMWDDDDDDKRLVGKEFFNPLSAQFLKYNLGGNFFAPLGGIEIYLRTAARTAAGGRTDRYGRFKEFDGYQNGSTTDELLTTFVMNKLSPTMQLAAAALNREAKFETLETPGQIMQYVVQNTIYPLTMHDSVGAFAEHGIPTGAALTLMNFVGLSSWSYGHVKRDTAVRNFNASLKAYNEFTKAGETEKLRDLMNRYDWLKPQYRVRLVNLAGQYRKLADKNKRMIAAGHANANMMARQAQLAEQIYAIMHEAEGQ